MRRKKLLFYSMLAVILGAVASPVLAADPLRFDTPVSQRLRLHVQIYLEKSDNEISLPVFAGIDLNGDGIEEYIVRDSSCNGTDFCTFVIFADDGESVLELGRIEARRLTLGAGYTGNVRNLLASVNPANDYQYQLYVWEPLQYRYTIRNENKSEGS